MTRRATCEPLVESIFPLFIRMSFSRRWFFNVVSLHKNLIRFSFVSIRFHLIIIYELCMKSNIHLNVSHPFWDWCDKRIYIFLYFCCCILRIFVQQFSSHNFFFLIGIYKCTSKKDGKIGKKKTRKKGPPNLVERNENCF